MVKYAATLALLSAALMCATLSYSIVTVNKHLSATLMKLDEILDKLNGKNGLIQELGKTIVDAKHLIGDADIAENDEISQIAAWNNQISQALLDFHTAMITTTATVAALQAPIEQSNRTLTSANDTVRLLQAPIGQLNADLVALQPVIAHTDALVSNPDITALVAHSEATMSHVEATTADVQQEVHSITHPTWAHKVWSWSLALVHALNPL